MIKKLFKRNCPNTPPRKVNVPFATFTLVVPHLHTHGGTLYPGVCGYVWGGYVSPHSTGPVVDSVDLHVVILLKFWLNFSQKSDFSCFVEICCRLF
jgi:hypothetical protein